MEALITGTNTRVMWGRQSRTREAPTGQGAKMEAAAEQDGSVCVCAENNKKKKPHTHSHSPGFYAASQKRWRSGRGVKIVVCFRLTAGYTDGRLFPFKFVGNLFCPWFPFCCSAAHSCCLSAQSCGCDMRPIRYGVDYLLRLVMWGN